MKILFLGSFISDEFAERVEDLSAAGNQFQYNLYCSLSKDNETCALCYLPIHFERTNEINDRLMQENIEIFLPKEKNIIKELYKIKMRIRSLGKNVDCIISYNVQYPWLHVKSKAKKVLVLADYTPVREEKGLLKKIYAYLIQKSFKQYDKIVVLSEGSKKYVQSLQECTVVHGCIKWENFQHFQKPYKNRNIVFLYAGVLNRITGVDLLLKAFMKTQNANYRLVLCGQGKELDKQIKKAVEMDSRISFIGYVPKNDYLHLLEKANVVVNPRNMCYQQNTYNFPSKILEYLASGRIIVSTKFRGWEEFLENIDFVESDVESLYRGLERAADLVCSDETRIYEMNRAYARTLTWDACKGKFLPRAL